MVSPRFPASEGSQLIPNTTKSAIPIEEEKIFKKEGTRGQYYTMEGIKNLNKPKNKLNEVHVVSEQPKSKSIEFPDQPQYELNQNKSVDNKLEKSNIWSIKQDDNTNAIPNKSSVIQRINLERLQSMLANLKIIYKTVDDGTLQSILTDIVIYLPANITYSRGTIF
jgi:hypothetical protein